MVEAMVKFKHGIGKFYATHFTQSIAVGTFESGREKGVASA
jgi:hypothetical protein